MEIKVGRRRCRVERNFVEWKLCLFMNILLAGE
jgi:hypothetical protein